MKVKKGYTLLEIVVALAILTIMILPLANSLVSSVKANKMAETKQESKLISQEIIEKLRTIGDVKEMTGANSLKLGSNGDLVSINKDSIDNTKFSVSGIVQDIEVRGTISRKSTEGEIIDTSDEYAQKEINLLFVVENLPNGDSNIAYYYDATGPKTIDEHLSTSTKVPLLNKNAINVLFEEKNSNVRCTIANKGANGIGVDTILPSIINTSGNPISVAVYVKDNRDGTVGKELISLNLDSLKQGGKEPGVTIEAYFLNNKFVQPNTTVVPVEGEFKDSFIETKKIGKSVNVTDNITYIEKSNRSNKGLYTIDITTKKGNVVENTKSEFVVGK